MGWEDRRYGRDRGGELGGPLRFLLFGSVPFFTVFNIRVRAHISLILFIGLTLLLGGVGSTSFGWQSRLEAMTILFVIILLHEFGHCFAGRWVGGDADEIMLTPLGGLAMANAPHRPVATLITVAGGPAVNVIICLITGVALYALTRTVPWNPVQYYTMHIAPDSASWRHVPSYLFWIYSMSYGLLVFNLLPIFPLDGGQMLQSILWFKLGYYRSMMIACVVGLVGGAILALVGLYRGSFLLIFIAASGILTCYSMRRSLREAGPELEYANDTMDFSASLKPDRPPGKKRRKVRRWRMRRLRRQAEREMAEQQNIDNILSKVSARGMQSLSWLERRALRRATERQRQRELEMSRQD